MSDPTPAEAEMTAETVEVQYNGMAFTMPASLDDADGDVIDAIDDQKLSHALRGLLDNEQWERFKATKPKVRDYGGLFEAFAAAIGLEGVGE